MRQCCGATSAHARMPLFSSANRVPIEAGQVRGWDSAEQRGYNFSLKHNCHVFFDGAGCEIAPPLCEGAVVFFEFYRDEECLPNAKNVRRAEPREFDEIERTFNEADEAQRVLKQRGTAHSWEYINRLLGYPTVASQQQLAVGKLEARIEHVKRSRSAEAMTEEAGRKKRKRMSE